MLTKEQVRKPGTLLDTGNTELKYSTVNVFNSHLAGSSTNKDPWVEGPITSRVSFGNRIHDSIEYIIYDVPSYQDNNYYITPMSELQRIGIVEPDKKEFKIGDKVKIPKKKSRDSSFGDFKRQTQTYNLDYLIVEQVSANLIVLRKADNTFLGQCNFVAEDLEHYEEPMTQLQDCVLSTIGSPKQPKTDIMDKKIIGYELIEPYPGVEVPTKLRPNAFDSTLWMVDKKDISESVRNPQKHPKFWKPIYEDNKVKIDKYELIRDCPGSLKIGCVYLNRDIITFLQKIIGDDSIKAELTILGFKITKEMVDKAYKLLDS